MARINPLPLKEINGLPYPFQEWLRKLEKFINLSELNHQDLSNLQGGDSTGRYHLTLTQHSAITAIPAQEIVFGSGLGYVDSDPNLKFDSGLNRLSAGLIKANNFGGFISSDGSSGVTDTITTASLVGKTVTIKDGIITDIS